MTDIRSNRARLAEQGISVPGPGRYRELLGVVKQEYEDMVKNEVQRAISADEDAIAELKRLAGEQLDRDCVDALVSNLDEVEKIQQQFSEDYYEDEE